MRPEGCVYPFCLKCTLGDCMYNDVERRDEVDADKRDKLANYLNADNRTRERIDYNRTPERKEGFKRYKQSDKGKNSQHKYNQSDKHKEAVKRYNQSDKRKESQLKYNQSDKGKMAKKRYEQSEKGMLVARKKKKKQVESGKNAEYCRKYYYRRKMEKLGGVAE